MSASSKLILFHCLLALLIWAHSLCGQSLQYDIYKGDEIIGEIKVEKRVEGDVVAYEANSVSTFSLLFSNELSTHTSSSFLHNELQYAKSEILLNDKIREHNVTRKKGDAYHFYQHQDEEEIVKGGPFLNSTTTLYYAEPVGVEEVFSENYQQLCPLKPIGVNAYELALPGGKVNQYFYKSGKLVEVKVIRTFMDLSFRLKSRS